MTEYNYPTIEPLKMNKEQYKKFLNNSAFDKHTEHADTNTNTNTSNSIHSNVKKLQQLVNGSALLQPNQPVLKHWRTTKETDINYFDFLEASLCSSPECDLNVCDWLLYVYKVLQIFCPPSIDAMYKNTQITDKHTKEELGWQCDFTLYGKMDPSEYYWCRTVLLVALKTLTGASVCDGVLTSNTISGMPALTTIQEYEWEQLEEGLSSKNERLRTLLKKGKWSRSQYDNKDSIILLQAVDAYVHFLQWITSPKDHNDWTKGNRIFQHEWDPVIALLLTLNERVFDEVSSTTNLPKNSLKKRVNVVQLYMEHQPFYDFSQYKKALRIEPQPLDTKDEEMVFFPIGYEYDLCGESEWAKVGTARLRTPNLESSIVCTYTNLNIFGVTATGNSVYVRCSGYDPCFFVRLPDNYDEMKLKTFIQLLEQELRALATKEQHMREWQAKKSRSHSADDNHFASKNGAEGNSMDGYRRMLASMDARGLNFQKHKEDIMQCGNDIGTAHLMSDSVFEYLLERNPPDTLPQDKYYPRKGKMGWSSQFNNKHSFVPYNDMRCMITQWEIINGKSCIGYNGSEPHRMIKVSVAYPLLIRKARELLSYPQGTPFVNKDVEENANYADDADKDYNANDTNGKRKKNQVRGGKNKRFKNELEIESWLPVGLMPVYDDCMDLVEQRHKDSGVRPVQAFQTFEMNVDFVISFLVNNTLKAGHWYRLPPGSFLDLTDQRHNPGVRRSRCDYEIRTWHKSIQVLDKKEDVPNVLSIAFDTEWRTRKHFPTYLEDPMIQICFFVYSERSPKDVMKVVFTLQYTEPSGPEGDGEDVYWFLTERSMFQAIRQFLLQVDVDMLVSHNGNHFDIQYMINRARVLGITDFPDWGKLLGSKLRMTTKIHKGRDRSMVAVDGRVIFDFMYFSQDGLRETDNRLNILAQKYLGTSKAEISVTMLGSFQKSVQGRNKIKHYVIKDVFMTHGLASTKHKCFLTSWQKSKITNVAIQSGIDRGVTFQIMGLLLTRMRTHDPRMIYLLPTGSLARMYSDEEMAAIMASLKKYKGATVLEPERGFYGYGVKEGKGCVVLLDFNSLYPSIIRLLKLCLLTSVSNRVIERDGLQKDIDYFRLPDIVEDKDTRDVRLVDNPQNPCFIQNEKLVEGIISNVETLLWDMRKYVKKEMIVYTTLATLLEYLIKEPPNTSDWRSASDAIHRHLSIIEKDCVLGFGKKFPELAEIVADQYAELDRTSAHEDRISKYKEQHQRMKFVADKKNSEQNEIKIVMNSIYGFVGAKDSSVKDLDPVSWTPTPFDENNLVKKIAMTITAQGRQMILLSKKCVEENYTRAKGYPFDAKVIYGDSVLGHTPLLLRRANGSLTIVQVDELVDRWSHTEAGVEKEHQIPDESVQVWTEQGWTTVDAVMRHRTKKQVYRVCTPSGLVDVTEDHSLLDNNGVDIRPTDVRLHITRLMTSYPDKFDDVMSSTRTPSNHEHEHEHEDVAFLYGVFFRYGTIRTEQVQLLMPSTSRLSQSDPPLKKKQSAATNILSMLSSPRSPRISPKSSPRAIETRKDIKETLELVGLPGDLKYLKRLNGALIRNFELHIDPCEVRGICCRIGFSSVNNEQSPAKRIISTFKELFYRAKSKGRKRIPDLVLNGDVEQIRSFMEGCGVRDPGHMKYIVYGQIAAMGMYHLLRKLKIEQVAVLPATGKEPGMEYYTVLSGNRHSDNKDAEETLFSVLAQNDSNRSLVLKMIPMPIDTDTDTDTVVYDLTTRNHHFHAGVGSLIVHNTDSIFPWLKGYYGTVNGLLPILEEMAARVTKLFSEPATLGVEAVVRNLCMLDKKIYCGLKYDYEKKKWLPFRKGMGIKSDTPNWIKDTHRKFSEAITFNSDLEGALDLYADAVHRLNTGQVNFRDLQMTKAMSKTVDEYANKNIPQVTIAKRKMDRGEMVKRGDRVNWVVTSSASRKDKKCEKAMETMQAWGNDVQLDLVHYTTLLNNQVEKLLVPILQDDTKGHLLTKKVLTKDPRTRVIKKTVISKSSVMRQHVVRYGLCAGPKCRNTTATPKNDDERLDQAVGVLFDVESKEKSVAMKKQVFCSKQCQASYKHDGLLRDLLDVVHIVKNKRACYKKCVSCIGDQQMIRNCEANDCDNMWKRVSVQKSLEITKCLLPPRLAVLSSLPVEVKRASLRLLYNCNGYVLEGTMAKEVQEDLPVLEDYLKDRYPRHFSEQVRAKIDMMDIEQCTVADLYSDRFQQAMGNKQCLEEMTEVEYNDEEFGAVSGVRKDVFEVIRRLKGEFNKKQGTIDGYFGVQTNQ